MRGRRTKIDEGYVAMVLCRMCGKDSGSVLLNLRLTDIPENQKWDPNPCAECVERLKTMVYFIGNCGHSGFVKDHVVSEMLKPDADGLVDSILERRMVRMEQCFACVTGQGIEGFDTV